MLALVWSMSGSGFVTEAFATASSACQSMFNSVPVATYQGMMNALGSWTEYAKATKRKGTKVKRIAHGSAHPQAPQIWITMLWHMGLRLPWRWKLGRSDSSERQHVLEMLGAQIFPGNSLFCGDAGFVGYHFWQGIINDGYDFMVRVGSNASLLAEYCDYMKQPDGNVLCWPERNFRRLR